MERYSYNRQAGVRWDPKFLQQIQRNTAGNNHAGALIMGAAMLGHKMLEKKFGLVAELHQLEGHMHRGLRLYSDDLYKDLMDYAKRVLDPEQYEEFHSSF